MAYDTEDHASFVVDVDRPLIDSRSYHESANAQQGYFIQPPTSRLASNEPSKYFLSRGLYYGQKLVLNRTVAISVTSMYIAQCCLFGVLLGYPHLRVELGTSRVLGNFAMFSLGVAGLCHVLSWHRNESLRAELCTGFVAGNDIDQLCVAKIQLESTAAVSFSTVQRMHALWSELETRNKNLNIHTGHRDGVMSPILADVIMFLAAGSGMVLFVPAALGWMFHTETTIPECAFGLIGSTAFLFVPPAAGVGITLLMLEASLLAARVTLFIKEILSGVHAAVGDTTGTVDERLLQTQQSQLNILAAKKGSPRRLSNPVPVQHAQTTENAVTLCTGTMNDPPYHRASEWSVDEMQFWMLNLVEGISKSHLEKYALVIAEETLDGGTFCRTPPDQLKDVFGSSFPDHTKIKHARISMMKAVPGMQDADEFLTEYVAMKDYFTSASSAWQPTILLSMAGGMLSFMIAAVNMTAGVGNFAALLGQMGSGLFFFFFVVVLALAVNNACNEIREAVVTTHPSAFGFFEGPPTGKKTDTAHTALLKYLKLNPVYFLVYGFAITPAWAFGFATGTGGTTAFALLWNQYNQ
jgi:hypothetical protein